MAERNALVVINGAVQELPSGDTLAGASGGGGVTLPSLTGNTGKVLAVNGAEDDTEWVDQAGGSPSLAPTITEETDSFTVTNTHLANAYVEANKATQLDITVAPSLTGMVPFTVEATGAGDVVFVAGAGVTINSFESKLTLNGQYASATLIPKGSDVYTLIGNLK